VERIEIDLKSAGALSLPPGLWGHTPPCSGTSLDQLLPIAWRLRVTGWKKTHQNTPENVLADEVRKCKTISEGLLRAEPMKVAYCSTRFLAERCKNTCCAPTVRQARYG
jgi:hypothetical protein